MDQISEEWRKDAAIDSTELGTESLKIPQLHSKYMKIYFDERQKLKAYEFKSRETFLKKYEYFNGRMSREELEEAGWEPFVKKLMKHEIDMYIDSDKDIINIKMRMEAQKEKIDFLEEVLKNLNQRNYQIRNAIEWQRFTNGVN